MGYTVNHSKLATKLPREDMGCLAPNVSSVLPTGVWKGQRCFILCGGPSLEGFNFGPLRNERTIGVNKSFITYPTEVCYAMDQRFYDSVTYPNKKDPRSALLHNQWLKYTGIKVFLKYSGRWEFDPSVYIVHNIQKRVLSLDVEAGIFSGNNSGFGALMLAIALGSTQIYLLGCDMKVDHVKKKTHFHDGYSHQRFEQLESVLPKFAKDFTSFAGVIYEQGIKVVNLNMDSALNCFPKEDIRNIL
jgi:hypothetical protein